MVRNISSFKTSRSLFTRRNMQYNVPRDVALVVAQTLFGSKTIPNSTPIERLQQVLDKAYDDRIFSFRVIVLSR